MLRGTHYKSICGVRDTQFGNLRIFLPLRFSVNSIQFLKCKMARFGIRNCLKFQVKFKKQKNSKIFTLWGSEGTSQKHCLHDLCY